MDKPELEYINPATQHAREGTPLDDLWKPFVIVIVSIVVVPVALVALGLGLIYILALI